MKFLNFAFLPLTAVILTACGQSLTFSSATPNEVSTSNAAEGAGDVNDPVIWDPVTEMPIPQPAPQPAPAPLPQPQPQPVAEPQPANCADGLVLNTVGQCVAPVCPTGERRLCIYGFSIGDGQWAGAGFPQECNQNGIWIPEYQHFSTGWQYDQSMCTFSQAGYRYIPDEIPHGPYERSFYLQFFH